ncbi:MAG: hypothetical protein FWH10_00015 [Oscillospiraceae bacterium]|nr:hypothetical protein [Oscillospiraceae bacterium]
MKKTKVKSAAKTTEITGYGMVRENGQWVELRSLPDERRELHVDSINLTAVTALADMYGFTVVKTL